jgi:hypothetical protein
VEQVTFNSATRAGRTSATPADLAEGPWANPILVVTAARRGKLLSSSWGLLEYRERGWAAPGVVAAIQFTWVHPRGLVWLTVEDAAWITHVGAHARTAVMVDGVHPFPVRVSSSPSALTGYHAMAEHLPLTPVLLMRWSAARREVETATKFVHSLAGSGRVASLPVVRDLTAAELLLSRPTSSVQRAWVQAAREAMFASDAQMRGVLT